MCLAIPAKVVSVQEFMATVDMMGNERVVGSALVPDIKVGDYVLVHAGFAIEIIDEVTAKETETILLEEVEKLAEGE